MFGLHSGDRVAVIGSGGKTTLLMRLARDWQGGVLLTTTTKMGPPGPEIPFLPVEDLASGWAALPEPRRALTGRPVPGKLVGLTPAEVDALALPGLDLLVVEADGSRGLPAKGHADYEPVLFSSCTVGVAVLGMQALGRDVSPGQVHRPEILQQLVGSGPLGVPELERIARAYLDLLPAGRRLLVLSQATAAVRAEVEDLALRLRARVQAVLTQGKEGLEVIP